MKTKTFIASAVIALSFSAVPASALYGSGNNYDRPKTSQKVKEQAAKKHQMKKLEEARMKKELMEKELMEKEQMMAKEKMMAEDAMMAKDEMMAEEGKSYGSGTVGESDTMMKDKMMAEDTMMAKDKMMSTGLPENCPAGTKPHVDGTCLLVSGSLLFN